MLFRSGHVHDDATNMFFGTCLRRCCCCVVAALLPHLGLRDFTDLLPQKINLRLERSEQPEWQRGAVLIDADDCLVLVQLVGRQGPVAPP